ncbi:MAG: hypothetical protein IJ565_04235 [Bacilli bacterium]|nr:hypothetical protein [Bacilli bacterium]
MEEKKNIKVGNKTRKKTNKKVKLNNKFKILILVIIITLIICGIILFTFLHGKDDEKPTTTITITNTIDNYGYSLTNNATDYYKELFEKLKKTLDNENVNDELYASLVSQLFITDFYTLNNKIGNSDVGGLEFFLESSRDNFALKAKNTIYKSVKSNLYGDREQNLPEVTKVSVDSITKTSYSYNGITDSEAYNVKTSVTYDVDLGYPTEVRLTLVHNGSKIEIAKVN